MKYFFLSFFCIVFVVTSCKNTGNSAAKEMASEMCKAMALINDDDPMSVVEAKAALSKIAKKKEKYKRVTEEELLKVMQEMCPEGAARVVEIQSTK